MISRLPIGHPEYRYPPSKNPYWERNRAPEGRVLTDNETEAHAGRVRALFAGRPRRLHVEIGCNAGHVLVEWAAAEPRDAFIGIDWKHKAAHRGAEKTRARGCANAVFFRAHAERIQYMFGEGEIDRLYLFFPDPWQKKSQWKNRFVTAERLRELARIVAPGGTFEIRTDHAGYFEWIEAAVAEASAHWHVRARTIDRHAGNPEAAKLTIPEVTLFERLFIQRGIRIHALELERARLA
jgi:tRNA (guanine-N7-)-methyltransferase